MKEYKRPAIEVEFIDLESVCDAVQPSPLATVNFNDLTESNEFQWK